MKLRKTTALLCALLLCLTGCDRTAPSSSTSTASSKPAQETDNTAEVTDDQVYTVSLNQGELRMDASGKRIPDDPEATPTTSEQVLNDLLTEQPSVKIVSKTEDTGKDDEYGNPITRQMSKVLDLEGSLLSDWQEGQYTAVRGDMILRTNYPQRGMMDFAEPPADYRSELWNYRTNEVIIPQVDGLEKMGENTLVAYNSYFERRELLGLLDKDGKFIKTPPENLGKLGYPQSVGNRIIVDTVRNGVETSVLLDDSLEPLFEADDLRTGYAYGEKYVYYATKTSGAQEMGYVQLADGKVVFSMPSGAEELRSAINHYDGERMIRSEGNEVAYLCDAQGNKLSETYRSLVPNVTDRVSTSVEQPQYYYGLRDGKCERIDRDGKVLHSIDAVSANWVNVQAGGYVSVSYEDPTGSTEQLLDAELNTIIEKGKYNWMQPLRNWENGKETVFDGMFMGYQSFPTGADGLGRYLLLKEDGTVIMDRITDVGTVGENRIAVKRGFTAGLIDWDGNWIAQHSVFDGVNDDYNPWMI